MRCSSAAMNSSNLSTSAALRPCSRFRKPKMYAMFAGRDRWKNHSFLRKIAWRRTSACGLVRHAPAAPKSSSSSRVASAR